MENKELEKSVPVELEDDALDNVSGGVKFDLTRPVIKGEQQDDGAQGGSYAGGIAGCANSGEIKDC